MFRRIGRAAAVVGISTTVLLGSLTAGAAGAAGAAPAPPDNENWKVYSTHFSPNGHDIPLRYGRHDNTGGQPTGFGAYHIDDRNHRLVYDWDDFKGHIDKVLESSSTKCEKKNNNWECVSKLPTGVGQYGNMKVVYTHNDSGTPDGRARGIITAYYLHDCSCAAPAKDPTPEDLERR